MGTVILAAADGGTPDQLPVTGYPEVGVFQSAKFFQRKTLFA